MHGPVAWVYLLFGQKPVHDDSDALEAKANVVADEVMEPLSSSDEEEYNDAPPKPPPAVNVASSIPG